MDRIELVGAGFDFFEPVPLHDRGFQERGRRVGVVFEQLRRAAPVEHQVEAAVEIGIASAPGFRDPIPERRRDRQAIEIARRDDPVYGF